MRGQAVDEELRVLPCAGREQAHGLLHGHRDRHPPQPATRDFYTPFVPVRQTPEGGPRHGYAQAVPHPQRRRPESDPEVA